MPSAPSPAEPLRLAPARPSDLPAVAALHARAFPDSAITQLGSEAVRRYYAWLHEGPHDAELVLAWRGERLVGFCAAGWFRGAMRGFLRANRVYLAGHIARHPSLLGSEIVRERIALAVRLIWRFSRLGRRASPAAGPQDVRRFGVLAIATDPAARAGGEGRALMTEAEQRARREGYSAMTLTVHPDNARAVAFYERQGWQRQLEADGCWRGHMLRTLA